jgi:O-antigen ligase
MILIILSEPSPVEAIKTIIKRSAYILAPLSIVFIKYFPYGKRYSDSGMQMLTGVTLHKNTLGMMCLFFGIFFIWNLLVLWRQRNESNNFKEVIVHGLLIIQIGWLLHLANSATSIVGVIIGIIILIGLRKFKNNIKSLKYFLIFIVFFALVLNLSLDLSKIAFSGLEREETLTGRTNIWQKSLEIAGSPLIGVGYMSFWQSESRQKHFEMYAFRPTQAHNGYLETYLTLGLIGLALLLAILFSAIKKIKQRLVRLSDFDFQVLSMAYLLVMMLVNITEATFQGTGMFWSMALFISINCPQRNNGPFAQKAAGYGE